MKLFEQDWHELEYAGSFKTGRVFPLPGEMPRWRRLARAGYVTLDVVKVKRGAGFRTVALITPAGRDALAVRTR